MARQKNSLPFLYDEITDQIVGVNNSDQTQFYFPQTIAASCVPIARNSTNTVTDTDVVPFVDILIPAYSMGRNGFIRVEWHVTGTASAVAKSPQLLLGGVQIHRPQITATNAWTKTLTILQNRNSYTSQVSAFTQTGQQIMGTATAVTFTSTIDTSTDQLLTIASAWSAAAASENITLRRYHVEIVYAD